MRVILLLALYVQDSTSKTDELYFDAIDRPVTETSVIGPKGQHLCAGVELYWIVPSDFSSQQGILPASDGINPAITGIDAINVCKQLLFDQRLLKK